MPSTNVDGLLLVLVACAFSAKVLVAVLDLGGSAAWCSPLLAARRVTRRDSARTEKPVGKIQSGPRARASLGNEGRFRRREAGRERHTGHRLLRKDLCESTVGEGRKKGFEPLATDFRVPGSWACFLGFAAVEGAKDDAGSAQGWGRPTSGVEHPDDFLEAQGGGIGFDCATAVATCRTKGPIRIGVGG